MIEQGTALPEFEDPPVSEVAMSVQFNALPKLRSVQISNLWLSEFKDRLQSVEEHVPLEAAVERFGVKAPAMMELRLQTFQKPPVPRFWFLNESGTDLVQIQQDRFIRNWRRIKNEPYPRYEHVRAEFDRDFSTFASFVQNEGLGDLVVNQCELTYVNTIAPDGWKSHGEAHEVVAPWCGRCSDSFLPQPDEVEINANYIIPDADKSPIGRLYIRFSPGLKRTDNSPVLMLTLTARGEPRGDGIEGAFKFLAIAHEWIVRGFSSFTTPAMHAIWRRIHAK